MSWTDFYPILDESHISDFERDATQTELAELAGWLGVAQIFNERPVCKHRVATSLFWKNLTADEGELIVENRDQMKDAARLGLISRYAPWDHYVEPLMMGAKLLQVAKPEVVLRVYLAADLDFLVEDLVAVGCEVLLMQSTSLRHNPGAMWRFLALENTNEWITIIDADRGADIISDVERSEQAMASGLGLWRIPYFFDPERHYFDPGFYRPINACQFGARGGQPMTLLIQAFIWHNRRGTMRTTWQEPGDRGNEERHEIATTTWPSYGFDEWFLLAAIYPRMVVEGALTIFHWSLPKLSFCHALDVEYATWANPSSEIFHCPKPLPGGSAPWTRIYKRAGLAVRAECVVLRREREYYGAAQDILRQPQPSEIQTFRIFHGFLAELLSWVEENVFATWWVDLSVHLKLRDGVGEIFCDRRYAGVDVVACGHGFVLISREVADWAAKIGLKGPQWQENGILRFPKLDGPMTLWRTSFSNEFHREWLTVCSFLSLGSLLQAWIEQGRAKIINTSARQMGWSVR